MFVQDLDCSLALCLLEGRYFWDFAVSMSTKKISTNIFEVNRSTETRKDWRIDHFRKRILQHSGFCRGPLGKPSVVY